MPSTIYRDDLLASNERTHLLPKQRLRDPNKLEASTASCVEDADEYRSRWRSIRCLYFILFCTSISFTVTVVSIWPYLELVEPSSTTGFLGWVVASYSLGQLIASPLFGVWANKRHTSREPLIITLVISLGANVMYAYIESFPSNRGVYLLISRFLIGFGAGNVAVIRSYVAGATTVKERADVMANVAIVQSLGFVLGPGFQAALVPLGYPGPVHVTGLHLDLYTMPAFITALLVVAGIILVLSIFKEHRIHEESGFYSSVEEKGVYKMPDCKPDYLAAISVILISTVIFFVFTNFETIGTPLTMNMYAWPKSKATLYQSVLMLMAGGFSIFIYIVVKIIVKRVDERYLLIVGFVIHTIGFTIWLPWGDDLPDRTVATLEPASGMTASPSNISHFLFVHNDFHVDSVHRRNKTSTFETIFPSNPTQTMHGSTTTSTQTKTPTTLTSLFYTHTTTSPATSLTYSPNTEASVDTPMTTEPVTSWPTTLEPGNNTTNGTVEPAGCPWYFAWCSYTPRLSLPQYICGYFIEVLGHCINSVMAITLFSKILGPKPQGIWMGTITAAVSGGRTVGPIFVSQVYAAAGPRVTFAVTIGLLLLTIIGVAIVFKRLVPFAFPTDGVCPDNHRGAQP